MRAAIRQHVHGFTIVEMLIVIAVIGIIATITVIGYSSVSQRAASTTLEGDLTRAASKLNSTKSDAGTYPADLASASLEASSGTDYQYTYNSVANNYCLTAKNASNTAYHIANDGKPTEGPCNGHTGNAPTDLDCPSGYITVPGNSLFGTQKFCVMKYEAKNVGGVATSQAGGAPWTSISQSAAGTTASAACSGCHLVTSAEWLTIAHNLLSVDSNWTGGTIGSGSVYSGHNDNNPASLLAADSNDGNGYSGTGNTSGSGPEQRRTLTLSNGAVIWDLVGNAWEWVEGTTSGAGNQPGTIAGTGYAYRAWDTPNLLKGNFRTFFPSFGNASAATWSSSQGIGQVYASNTEGGLSVFRRGAGLATGGTNAGLFTITANNVPTTSDPTFSFRVAK